MGKKLPCIFLYTGDWLKDPALTLCSPATRGIWIDFLCAMHEQDRSGELRGTTEQLARVTRCSVHQLDHALSELTISGAATISDRNGVVTVINRRMKRESNARKQSAKRQKNHRDKLKNGSRDEESNAIITPLSRARAPTYSTSVSISNTNTQFERREETRGSVRGDSPGGDLSPLAALWNSVCLNLPKAIACSKQRLAKERLRLKAKPLLPWWEEAFKKINQSQFCCGQNDRGWKATFDWIIANDDNVLKVMEGKYDGTSGPGFKPKSPTTAERNAETIAKLKNWAGTPEARVCEGDGDALRVFPEPSIRRVEDEGLVRAAQGYEC